ncbi:MAG TPA: transglycosylase family protein [Nitriliruptorales bacterium]|nr:transglycosylase family protein [Nitriliruptorales bacterium]
MITVLMLMTTTLASNALVVASRRPAVAAERDALVRAAGRHDVHRLFELSGRAAALPTDAPARPPAVAESIKLQRQAVAPKRAVPTGSMWDRLAVCESSGNWSSSVGMFEGGLQFLPATWDEYKPPGMPDAAHRASREQQIAVAERVLVGQGWEAWPVCSRRLGLN